MGSRKPRGPKDLLNMKIVKKSRSKQPIRIVRRGIYGASEIRKQKNHRGNENFHSHSCFLSKLWQRLQMCRKLSTVQLTERLDYSNLPGLNSNMKNGSLKEGTLNWEMLQFKPKFPRQVLLCRVGEFYEAWGINVCILVEYEGLNPFGGLQSDSIPRAGCPVVNLRQTLDDRTQSGYSVVMPAILPVYEYMLLINFGLNTALWRRQAQGPTQARSRKRLFISGLKEGRGIWTEVKASSITDRNPT
ncbi:DNA mismatch repair protein MSH1, mitochondrial [Glycine soja]